MLLWLPPVLSGVVQGDGVCLAIADRFVNVPITTLGLHTLRCPRNPAGVSATDSADIVRVSGRRLGQYRARSWHEYPLARTPQS